MIKCNGWPISVCSWSLANDFDTLRSLAEQTGPFLLHLALSDALKGGGEDYLAGVKAAGLGISATMIDFAHEDYSTLDSIKITGGIVPDEHWPDDEKTVLAAIDLTEKLGVKFLSLHFGFIDPDNPAAESKLAERTGTIADYAGQRNITILMETGQETAGQLKHFLETLNHPALAVNFDPANMLLYDKGDPIEAVKTLARWIKHVHIKDATRTQTPGTWGAEVPWSAGQVNTADFLNALKQIGYTGVLAVEREAGDDRLADIKSAIEKLKNFAE